MAKLKTMILLLSAVTLTMGCASISPNLPPNLPGIPPIETVRNENIPLQTLSVLNFDNIKKDKRYAYLSKALSDMLTTTISSSKEIQVVQREKLKQVIEEQKLQLTGLVDERTAVEIGNFVGAQFILTGSYTVIEPMLTINAQLISVEKGTIIDAASVTGKLTNILNLQEQLARKICDILKIPAPQENYYPKVATKSPEAIENNYKGEDLLDEGELDEAMFYFLKASISDPNYTLASNNYSKCSIEINSIKQTIAHQLKWKQRKYSLQKKAVYPLYREIMEKGFDIEIGTPEISINPKNPTKVKIQFTVKICSTDYIKHVIRNCVPKVWGSTLEYGDFFKKDFSEGGPLVMHHEGRPFVFVIADNPEINESFHDLISRLGLLVTFKDSNRNFLYQKQIGGARYQNPEGEYNFQGQHWTKKEYLPSMPIYVLKYGYVRVDPCESYLLEFLWGKERAEKIQFIEAKVIKGPWKVIIEYGPVTAYGSPF